MLQNKDIAKNQKVKILLKILEGIGIFDQISGTFKFFQDRKAFQVCKTIRCPFLGIVKVDSGTSFYESLD